MKRFAAMDRNVRITSARLHIGLLLVVCLAVTAFAAGAARADDEIPTIELDLLPGRVLIPNVEGVSWGYGDTVCGYGLVIRMPAETRVCFNVEFKLVYVFDPVPADQKYVDIVLGSVSPQFVLQPETSPPVFPSPTPTRTPSNETPTPSESPTPSPSPPVPSTTPPPPQPPRPPATGTGTTTGSAASDWAPIAAAAAGALGLAAIAARRRRARPTPPRQR